ncbi:MAG: arginine deiminase family protein [Chitinophagales bacterium]
MANASTDIQKLKQVVVHYPDDGIEVITPDNALKFLYDDIVFLPKMREEHKLFTDVLSFFTGKENVLDTFQLLKDVLEKNPDNAKSKLLDYVCDHENCDDKEHNLLASLDTENLVYTLFTGILKETGGLLFPPLPNYIFTRDIGVLINDHVLICNASKRARTRESILTRCIIYYHPVFASCQEDNHKKIIDMTKVSDEHTIEGGDVMMFDENCILIGCSERSTPEAFTYLKDTLLEKNVLKNVVRIVIPKDRSCMHIDTLFTQISSDEYVIYQDTLESDMIKVTQFTADGKKIEHSTLKDFFLSYKPSMKFILCGNGDETFAAREQWTDGCNLVAVKDGVAIAYDRNERTADAMRNAGYTIIEAEDFLAAKMRADEVEKTIISIPSTELSRARGGPHCMTFPILRN